MPLAIELAAARARVLPIGQIASSLSERFRLLTSSSHTVPPRQHSLRETIDWSYNLLAPEEQCVLRRLSVFAGGFSLEAACAVAGDGCSQADMVAILARLVEKSLLLMEERAGMARYRLLETIRLYAWERLDEAGEREPMLRRFVSYYRYWIRELWRTTGGFAGGSPLVFCDSPILTMTTCGLPSAAAAGQARSKKGSRL